MYNGVGLATPRGSGTSGYVMKNLSHLKPKNQNLHKSTLYTETLEESKPMLRTISNEIIDHNKKREMELKVLEFIEELESQGKTPEEIETKAHGYRVRLLELHEKRCSEEKVDEQLAFDVKSRQNTEFRKAFKIRPSLKEGEAFNFSHTPN